MRDTFRLNQHLMSENSFTLENPEFTVGRQGKIMQVGAIVGFFKAVDQRTALQRDLSGLLTNLWVTVHAADRHR